MMYIYTSMGRMGLSDIWCIPPKNSQRWFYGRDNDHEPWDFKGREVLEDAKVERKAVDEARDAEDSHDVFFRWCPVMPKVVW